MLSKNYFFYEWLIIEKKITQEYFEKLNKIDILKLRVEFNKYWRNIK